MFRSCFDIGRAPIDILKNRATLSLKAIGLFVESALDATTIIPVILPSRSGVRAPLCSD